MKNHDQAESAKSDGAGAVIDLADHPSLPLDEPWASGQRKRYLASLPRQVS
jgi:hypothetical protein